MFKARDYLHKYCLSNLYHTYIFPYLIYCIEVWGNAPPPLSPSSLVFNTEKNFSANHILEIFSSYRT